MIITAGIYKGRKINTPDPKITRPTLSKIRMGVFNTLYSIIGDFTGKTFLDMFGGSGIMGLEALSRGFKDVQVFELNKKSAEIIKKNYNSLGIKPNLIIGDSLKLLQNSGKKYDIIYIDPPYNSEIYEKIIDKILSGIVVVEHTEQIDFSDCEVIKQKEYGGKFVSFIQK